MFVRRSGRINLKEAYKKPVKKRKKLLNQQTQDIINEMNITLNDLDSKASQELVAMEREDEHRSWFESYTCDKCKNSISLWRCYCRYCINPLDWHESYDLCLSCFLFAFDRTKHRHPRESFSLC